MRAVVTGAGSGLGRAFALDVAGRGGSVLVSDIDLEGAERTAELVRSAGGSAFVEVTDVRDRDAMFELARIAEEHLSAVDLLCNNAGVAVTGPFEEIEQEHWEWIVDINMWGVVFGCQAFLPGMLARGHGRVINVASAAGLVNAPGMSPYNLTKTAVIALSETLYAEYRGTGVNICVLCPTFFETSILENSRGPTNELDEQRARSRMSSSRVQAADVAKRAIDAVEAGRLHCVPMADGRFMWRLKRIAPEPFHRIASRIARFMKSRQP